MKVRPPESLLLRREELLADVRERLEARLPSWAGELVDDPSDPAWMVLEEVAWMAELLSGQLDRFPHAVLRQVVHLMGGRRRPASPALAAAVLRPASAGVLVEDAARPGALQIHSSRTEAHEAVSFVPAEDRVALRPGLVSSLVDIVDGELFVVGQPWSERPDVDGQVLRRGEARPARLLEEEEISWTVRSADAEGTRQRLQAAVDGLLAEGPGWLGLTLEEGEAGELVVRARIDPARAFARSAPGGMAPGGDLEARWGTLEGSAWSPPVRIPDVPGVPLDLRGSRPEAGLRPGTLLLPEVPANQAVRGLLERRPVPVPAGVVGDIWRALLDRDLSLASLRPRTRHTVRSLPALGEPDWVPAALEAGLWGQLAGSGRRSAFSIRLPERARGRGALRLGLVVPTGRDGGLPRLHLHGLTEAEGVEGGTLAHRVAWRLPVPGRPGRRQVEELVALDVELDARHEGLVLLCEAPVQQALLNPVLLVNAPVVEDDRVVDIRRTVPEAVSLRFGDLVTPEVREALLAQPLPPETRSLLERLPLARLEVSDGTVLSDFEGVSVAASEGELVLNAPDERGREHRVGRGQAVTVAWYRRTDGAAGRVPEGALHEVDQRAGARVRVLGAANPTGAVLGEDREGDDAALERIFGSSQGMPVLASDWERLVRLELGERAQAWRVQVWTHAERALLPTFLWPGGRRQDAETRRLAEALRAAGPETLLVVLGPEDGRLSEAELAWARRVVEALVQRHRARLPLVRAVEVSRLWSLRVDADGVSATQRFPTHEQPEGTGFLRDAEGRVARPAPGTLLLNAVITGVHVAEGWGP